MEINEINTFVKVVQTKSFTKAAELLGTQKSNVSRTINNLETKLQVRLLERNNRQLTVTHIGELIYQKCMKALAHIAEAESLAKQELGEPSGLLRITSGVEFGMMFVNHWINQFVQNNPEISVEANFTNELVDLIQDGFDLAIRLGALEDSELIAKRLGDLDYGLFASPDYLSAFGMPSHPKELISHDCIVFNAGHKENWTFIENEKPLTIEVKGRIKINNIFSVMQAAELGFGIAKLPKPLAKNNAQLTQILLDAEIPKVPIFAVFPSFRFLSPKVKQFIELANQECESLELNKPFKYPSVN